MRKAFLCLLLMLAAALTAVQALAGNDSIYLKVRADGNTRAYQDNPITIETSRAGELTLSVFDKYNEYTTVCEDYAVNAGTTTILWDGRCTDGSRLEAGAYSFRVLFRTAEGETEQTVAFKMGRPRQAILCALRSGAINDRSGNWYVEVKLIRQGELITEFYKADDLSEPIYTHHKQVNNFRVLKWEWDGRTGRETLPSGDYILRFYAKETPAYVIDVPVTLTDEPITAPAVAPTGPVMPAADATDEEIWQLMTQPAVVVDIKSTSHQDVYEKPDRYSKKLGTLHGQSQTLEVHELTADGWAKISAWRHEDGCPVTGYVPAGKLKAVQPQTDYGLIVDKRAQTLTVFEHGIRLGTIMISTGLPTRAKPEQETPAGSYLTLEHMVEYGMNGKRYPYVIRYDGGNLLHSIAYQPRSGKADYSKHTATLGEKASNGCLRLQQLPGEAGINACWIYTNIPVNTRLIILDDPDERAALTQELQKKK